MHPGNIGARFNLARVTKQAILACLGGTVVYHDYNPFWPCNFAAVGLVQPALLAQVALRVAQVLVWRLFCMRYIVLIGKLAA